MDNEMLRCDMLTSREVSDLLQVTRHTLQLWRAAGKGPPWVRLESVIRYPAEQFREWLSVNRHRAKGEAPSRNFAIVFPSRG